jgi:hypothetical protein
VHHAHFLENVAYHMRNGGFLGTFSLLPQQEEAQKFLEAYASCAPSNSIVCASVASAVEGRFGNYHHPATNARTAGSKLFINPLMSMYWCFDLEHVAACTRRLLRSAMFVYMLTVNCSCVLFARAGENDVECASQEHHP